MSEDILDTIREALHPDLRPHLYAHERLGAMLHHPLVVNVMPNAIFAQYANQQFEQKTEALAQAREKREWHTVVFLHERPYRFEALTAAVELGVTENPQVYWELVGNIWTDSENIHENFDEWEMLWSEPVPGRESIMDEDERAALAALPDMVTIYRGVAHEDAMAGLSWTTDRAKALWFARRYKFKGDDYDPYLVRAKVAKANILAYFLGRGESEVVVLPRHLTEFYFERLESDDEP